jgi:hypothetical protein
MPKKMAKVSKTATSRFTQKGLFVINENTINK